MTSVALTSLARNDHIERQPINLATFQAAHGAESRRIAQVPHSGVYYGLAGFFAWMLLVYVLLFRHETEAMFSVVVSAFYTVVYLAVPAIAWRMARRETGSPPEGSFRGFLAGQLQTATGPLSGWEATLQIWCIPAALALAATGMAIAMRLS